MAAGRPRPTWPSSTTPRSRRTARCTSAPPGPSRGPRPPRSRPSSARSSRSTSWGTRSSGWCSGCRSPGCAGGARSGPPTPTARGRAPAGRGGGPAVAGAGRAAAAAWVRHPDADRGGRLRDVAVVLEIQEDPGSEWTGSTWWSRPRCRRSTGCWGGGCSRCTARAGAGPSPAPFPAARCRASSFGSRGGLQRNGDRGAGRGGDRGGGAGHGGAPGRRPLCVLSGADLADQSDPAGDDRAGVT